MLDVSKVVIVKGRSDNNVQHSGDVRGPRVLDTGAASTPYAAVYFKRLPP